MKVLAVNPGSTSTKIALYEPAGELWRRSVAHSSEEQVLYPTLADQLELRRGALLALLAAEGGVSGQVGAVIGRGGLLRPLPGGVYRVNEPMKRDLRAGRYGVHASNLGALLADDLAAELGVPAFIADPVVVDELGELARYTGLPEITRRSIFHALNQKATARKAARELGRRYEECSLIVAHMGGGTSVGVHQNGKVTDVNNALDGDGPFSVERAGRLPPGDWMRYVLGHLHEPAELQRKLAGRGGLVAYLGCNDARAVEEAAAAYSRGQPSAGLDGARCLELLQAMCYQIAKEICALAAVVSGRVDAVVLTGGLARSSLIEALIRERVSFLAPVLVYPGENELEALARAAFAALEGSEPVGEYGG